MTAHHRKLWGGKELHGCVSHSVISLVVQGVKWVSAGILSWRLCFAATCRVWRKSLSTEAAWNCCPTALPSLLSRTPAVEQRGQNPLHLQLLEEACYLHPGPMNGDPHSLVVSHPSHCLAGMVGRWFTFMTQEHTEWDMKVVSHVPVLYMDDIRCLSSGVCPMQRGSTAGWWEANFPPFLTPSLTPITCFLPPTLIP